MPKIQSPITFPIWDVKDIGLKSSSMLVGGETFGTGTTIDFFRAFGKIPWIIDELYMSVMIGASSKPNIFRILFGNVSGPGDFGSFDCTRFLVDLLGVDKVFTWYF